MGISIGNCKHSIDMTYGGFYRLRNKIAELLNEDFGKLYHEWTDISPYNTMTDEQGNERLAQLYADHKIKDEDDVILDFLFQSDCAGKVSYQVCKKLYKVVEDYDDDFCYGYPGRPDYATFKEFKEILVECYKNRWILKWY